MADIAGTYSSPYSGPQFYYNISYSETGRSASAVTYRFTIESWMGGGWFGYSLDYTLGINGYVFKGNIKGTEQWSGTTHHYTSFDASLPCSAGAGQLGAELYITRRSGEGGDGTSGYLYTGGKTVNVSSWNTPPYWPSGAVCNATPSGIVPENTTSLSISWSAAKDNEGNAISYTVKRYVNGSYDGVVVTGTTALSCTDNIGSGNAGATYNYTVDAYDGMYWSSSSITSNGVVKNTLTPSPLTSSSTVDFNTINIAFNVPGGANSNGNTTLTYALSCDKVTIYNPAVNKGTINIAIYRTGTTPTGPYVKFEDIKSALASSSYKGTLVFTLTTTNAYGSSKTSNVSISTNLQMVPSAIASITPGGYYTIGGTQYYIPNQKAVTVSWATSSDPLGTAIKYDVQLKIGYDDFKTAFTALTATSCTLAIAAVTYTTDCIIRIIAKTTYGTSTSKDVAIKLDYYYPPTISFNPTVRNQYNTVVSGSVNIKSSIPGLSVTILKYTGKSEIETNIPSPSTSFNITDAALSETDTYTFTVKAQDSGGSIIGTALGSASVVIPRYIPFFSIRKRGIGINALADAIYGFVVGFKTRFKGDVDIDGNETVSGKLDVTGNITAGNITASSGVANSIVKRDSNGYIQNTWFNSSRAAQNTAAESYIYDSGDGYLRKKTIDNVKAELVVNTKVNNAVAADGAKILDLGDTGYIKTGSADAANFGGCNIDIASWQGVGFKGLAGNPYGDGSITLAINARTGELNARGWGCFGWGAGSKCVAVGNGNEVNAWASGTSGLWLNYQGGTSGGVYVGNGSNSSTFGPIKASAFNNGSDISLKTNLVPIGDDTLNKLSSVQVYSFDFKDELESYSRAVEAYADKDDDSQTSEPMFPKRHIGVIAQDIEKVFPTIVSESVDSDGTVMPKTLDIYGLLSITIKALQELNTKVVDQQAEIEELKKYIK